MPSPLVIIGLPSYFILIVTFDARLFLDNIFFYNFVNPFSDNRLRNLLINNHPAGHINAFFAPMNTLLYNRFLTA